jgi:hypothetical protein
MRTQFGRSLDRQELAWRREQLAASGFPLPLAIRLSADRRYDLHRLIELVERGCSPQLAVRILAPLDEPEAQSRGLDRGDRRAEVAALPAPDRS